MTTTAKKEYYYQIENEIDSYFSSKYKSHYSRDGVVNPDIMFSDENRPNVVMLLKENRNNKNGNQGNWAPRDVGELFPHKDNTSRCWAPNICRTVHYVISGFSDWWENVPREPESVFPKKRSVSGFAYINVKKNDEGQDLSDDFDLGDYAEKDSEMLRKQVISCEPDILFCCQKSKSNYGLKRLKMIMGTELKALDSCNFAFVMDYDYFGRKHKMLVVNWFHPSRNTKGFKKADMRSKLNAISSYVARAIKFNLDADQLLNP